MKQFARSIFFGVAWAFVMGVGHGEEDLVAPPDLVKARLSYQQHVKDATDPIKAQYLAYLDTLKKSLGAKGEAGAAMAVQREIDAPTGETASSSTEATGTTKDVVDPPDLVKTRALYQKHIKSATDPIKAQYAVYLDTLKKSLGAKGEASSAMAVQKEIESLAGGNAPSTNEAVEGAKLVIWNTNNGGKADRGTKRINIILFAGERETWRLNGALLKWSATRQTSDEIKVPDVAVDKIRIEIRESAGKGGGLAEVEFVRDGKNLAKGQSVQVSAVWENDSKVVGSMLTDGDRSTDWLIPNKTMGWAEILLPGTK